MKTILIIISIIAILTLVGCNSATTGMTTGKANAPEMLTKAELINGVKLDPTISYVKFSSDLTPIKFNKLNYTKNLSYVGRIEDTFVRYANPEGRFSHRIGSSYRGMAWKNLNKLTIESGTIYEIYLEGDVGDYLKYSPTK